MRAVWIPGGRLEAWDAELEDPENLMDIIGLHMVDGSAEAFYNERWGDKKWDEHPAPRWASIITDLIEGRNEPRDGLLERGQTLVDKGNLRNSITWDPIERYVMVVGSNLDYSALLNDGGPDEIGPWTKDVRRRLWAWMKKQAKWVRDALGWMLNKKWLNEPVRFTHPERQFVGLTEEMADNIQRDIERFFAEGY